MDENTRLIYKKYGLDPEQTHNEAVQLLEQRYKKIDEHFKKYLKKQVEKGLTEEYFNYSRYIRHPRFYCFVYLEPLIAENIQCLIIRAYTASITLSYHILERALKLALIQNESGIIPKSVDEWNNAYKSSHRYVGWTMSKTLINCKNEKLITKDMFSELEEFGLKLRNGFSHYDPNKILCDEEDTKKGGIFSKEGKIDREIELNIKQIPSFQNYFVNKFAENNADFYFCSVMSVIEHIEKVFKKRYYVQFMEGNMVQNSSNK